MLNDHDEGSPLRHPSTAACPARGGTDSRVFTLELNADRCIVEALGLGFDPDSCGDGDIDPDSMYIVQVAPCLQAVFASLLQHVASGVYRGKTLR